MKAYFILFILLIFCSSCSIEKNYLPDEFWGMKLKRKLTGNEAKDFIDRLHFQNVATEKNEIGFYSGEIGNATIYITYYKNQKIAQEDFIKMAKKISPENSVFVQGEFETVNNKQIYSCLGMGQVHYVFSHKNLLFWISAEQHFSKEFLEEYLRIL
ncbi:MAG: hypothetical protein NZM09_12020 [Ignavibacterium sp.]|nr:hypothetical protein [Ignavibacterium sp.]MDW8376401.1 hypothetical protein [Ignavibacteriales bacterium]